MNIGEVLAQLKEDFPDLLVSKVRYYEAEGLVEPERTSSGYRKYTQDDVDRLRYALTLQRDHYLPLRVIKEHLDAIDRGLDPPELPGGPRVPQVALASNGYPAPEAFGRDPSSLRLSRSELLRTAEIDGELLDQLEEFGLVTARSGSAPYDGDALLVATTAGELAAFGLHPRHLRPFRNAADREVGLVEQVVAPIRASREAGAEGRAEEVQRQIAALSVRLHAALVKARLHSAR
jgi:DNA-binding transcriptional MerR regulator